VELREMQNQRQPCRSVVIVPGIDGAGYLFGPVIERLKAGGWGVSLVEHCDEAEWLGGDPSIGPVAARIGNAMDEAGFARAIVCAESFGGMPALEFARRMPERVAGMVLCGAFAWLPFRARRSLLRVVSPAIGRAASLIPTPAMRLAARVWHPLVRRRDPAELRDRARHSHVSSAACAWAKIRVSMDFDARGWLKEIRTRTIVITGDRDPVVPVTCARQLAANIPCAELVVVPDAGHLAHHAHPEVLLDAIHRIAQAGAGPL
jgi:3-oxoadipate enol-lactonase